MAPLVGDGVGGALDKEGGALPFPAAWKWEARSQ